MEIEARALTILQPWAWCVVQGHKPVENRTVRTSFRGWFLIHAGKTNESHFHSTSHCINLVRSKHGIECPSVAMLEFGSFIGIVELHEVVTALSDPWFKGPYGYMVRGALSFKAIPCRGNVGFWRVPPKVIEKLPSFAIEKLKTNAAWKGAEKE